MKTLMLRDARLILESSDWHQNPYGLGQGVVRFIRMGQRQGAILIGNGDLFDLVIYGVKKYKGSETIKDFKRVLDSYPFFYVCGNHDPDHMVRQVLKDMPNVIILNSCDIGDWHFEHGDRLAIDWGWLRPVYLWAAGVALRVCPRAWLKFCEWRGWKRPGTPHNPPPSGTESEGYTDLVGIVWGNALKEAEKSKLNFCIGHTHTPRMILSATGHGHVVDGGDLNDGSYIEIKRGEPQLSWIIPDTSKRCSRESP